MNTRNILIVDDSATMRAMVSAIVGAHGDYHVIEASSGFEALRLLPRFSIDLILTDINMPDINGLELIRYLKSNPNYTAIPVFIISTEGSGQDIERGIKLGASEYLVKPFPPDSLQKLLSKYLV